MGEPSSGFESAGPVRDLIAEIEQDLDDALGELVDNTPPAGNSVVELALLTRAARALEDARFKVRRLMNLTDDPPPPPPPPPPPESSHGWGADA